MDSELNTNVGFFGASLEGYPHVNQFGSYNERISINNEEAHTDYVRTATDDLSHVWETNNRDNIDDLNVVLREADVNAHDADFYGAKELNVVTQDPDFSRFLDTSTKDAMEVPAETKPQDIKLVLRDVKELPDKCPCCPTLGGLFLIFLFYVFIGILFGMSVTYLVKKIKGAVN